MIIIFILYSALYDNKNQSKVLHTIKITEHYIQAWKIEYEGNKHRILRLCFKKNTNRK